MHAGVGGALPHARAVTRHQIMQNPGTLRSADTNIGQPAKKGVAERDPWFLNSPPPPVFNLNVHVGGG